MVGWLLDSSVLVQIFPAFVPMQFNTALCFFFSGMALCFIIKEREILALVLAFVIALIAGATLFQYPLNVNFGIDELFVAHKITTLTSHPGRMSPNSAICFLIVSAAIIFENAFSEDDHINLHHYLFGGALLIISGGAIVGYLTNTRFAYGWAYTGMALHTSLGFLLAGIIITSLEFKRRNINERRSRVLVSFYVLILFGIFTYFGTQLLRKQEIDHFKALYRERTAIIADRIQARVALVSNAVTRLLPLWQYQNEVNALQDSMQIVLDDFPTLEWIALQSIHFDGDGAPDQTLLLLRQKDSENSDLAPFTTGISKSEMNRASSGQSGQWHYLKNDYLYIGHQVLDGTQVTLILAGLSMDKIIKSTNTETIQQSFSLDIVDPGTHTQSADWLGVTFIQPVTFGALQKEIVFSNPDQHLYLDPWPWYWIFGLGVLFAVALSTLNYFYLRSRSTHKDLASVLNNTPIALIASRYDGTIIFANREAEKLFDYDANELLQQPIEVLVPMDSYSHTGLRDSFISAGVDKKMPVGAIKGLTKHGKQILIEIHLSFILFEGESVVLATIQDIAERDAQLRQTVSRGEVLMETLNSLDQGVIVLNGEGYCNYINSKASEFLGYSAAELLNKNFFEKVRHANKDGKLYTKENSPIWTAALTGATTAANADIFWGKHDNALSASYTTKLLAVPPYFGGVIIFFQV